MTPADRPAAPSPRRRRGLASQLALLTTVVAAVAVLLAGLVSLQLVRGAAESQSLAALERQAATLAGVADQGTGLALLRRGQARRLLTRQQIDIVVVQPGGRAVGAAAGVLRPGEADRLLAGVTISGVRRLDGRRVLVAGHGLDAGGAVLLVQPATVARGLSSDARRRTGIALLIGLVGAALAGGLLARRVARPLQHAAAAAHRMAAGGRDVRLTPAGPAEVAEVAEALNTLAGALSTSEGRQREFLLSISHELRTPLTAVRGYAEALADGVVPATEVAGTGTTMLAESERLNRLVSDLLDLARLGAQDFRLDLAPVDLTALVRQAGAVWESRCRPVGVRLLVEAAAGPIVVTTDATRVRQVVDGLAENALRLTPAGAVIVLSVVRVAGGAVLEVRDGGPGLSAEDCEVAFERSALYDRYRGVRRVGTGVGLALVAGLVARLGGSAHAGAAPEGGAAFTIRLPAG